MVRVTLLRIGRENSIRSCKAANKPSELADYSVCTTFCIKHKHFYLLNVLRKKFECVAEMVLHAIAWSVFVIEPTRCLLHPLGQSCAKAYRVRFAEAFVIEIDGV